MLLILPCIIFRSYIVFLNQCAGCALYLKHYQSLKMIILNLNSSVLLAQLCNIFQYSPSWVGPILDFSLFAQLSWVSGWVSEGGHNCLDGAFGRSEYSAGQCKEATEFCKGISSGHLWQPSVWPPVYTSHANQWSLSFGCHLVSAYMLCKK